MGAYIVTSDRLAGFKRGDILELSKLMDINVQHLVDAGHLSPHTIKKPAKTKDTDEKE